MGVAPAQALATLRAAAADGRLDLLCERHRIRILTVFGSSIHQPDTARDLDVAVAVERGSELDLLALIADLAGLTGSDDLDVMVLNSAGPVARERALVGCLALYESAPGAFAHAQMAAVGEWMDTAWLRKLDLELLCR